MSEHQQTPEEIDAHLSGPVRAVWDFIALLQSDPPFEAIWARIDPELKVRMAAAVVRANADAEIWDGRGTPEEIASYLAAGPHPGDIMWLAFAQTQKEELLDWAADINVKTWGAASRPRPVGVDSELVLLKDVGGQVELYDRPRVVTTYQVVVRHVREGWLIAGFKDPHPLDAV